MKKFESQLYPFDLYVSENAEDVKELVNYDTHEPLDIDPKEYNGITYKVRDKSNLTGILIWINPSVSDEERFCIITHEIIHAIGYAFDIITETMSGSEPEAYLGGWMAKCVYQTLNE